MKMWFTFLISVVILLRETLSQRAIKSGDAVFVTELVRHGARAPLSDIVNYIPRDWVKKYGKGELTGVGMRQHYYLGKNVRLKFPELLTDLTNYQEYYVRSTNVNRTLMSAQSHIMGLRGNAAFTQEKLIWDNKDPKVLPPVKDFNFDLNKINFDTPLPDGMTPFPVHNPNPNKDLLLGGDGPPCPTNLKQMKKDRSETNVSLRGNEKLQTLLEEALKAYNIQDKYKGAKDFTLCYHLGDFVRQDWYNNPNALLKPGDDLYERLSDCYHFGISNYYKTRNVAISTQSPYLSQLMAYVEDKLATFDYTTETFNKDAKFKLKYVLFSAHDDTLAPFLISLGYIDRQCLHEKVVNQDVKKSCNPSPPLASSIIWSVSYEPQGKKELNDDFFITTTYNGEPLQSTEKSKIGYQSKMSFRNFKSIIKKHLLITSVSDPRQFSSIEDYCGLIENEDQLVKYLSLSLLVLIIMVVVLLMSINNFNEQYQKMKMDLNEDGYFKQSKEGAAKYKDGPESFKAFASDISEAQKLQD